MMNRIIFLSCLLVYSCATQTIINNHENDRISRELEVAEKTIMASLIVASDKSGRYLCNDCPYACQGANKAEMGLMLIGAYNSNAALLKLGLLLRFNFDAGLSTDFNCYVLKKGERIKNIIKNIKAEDIFNQCIADVNDYLKKSTIQFDRIQAVKICRPPISINKNKEMLLKAIEENRKCPSTDF